MSNYLAVATVTAALRNRIENDVKGIVGTDSVTTGLPRFDNLTTLRANLFLFQVTPNVALRNMDLPTRGSDGMVTAKPRAAIDLHYLISFSGEGNSLGAHRMMGRVISSLHANPWLTSEEIQAAIEGDLFSGVLATSDLAQATERVKLTPSSLTLDELSKLWSIFLQIPYVMSLVYQASVVLIDADATPLPLIPVKAPGVFSATGQPPQIDSVLPLTGENQPIVLASTLVVRGQGLSSPNTVARFDSGQLAPITVVDDGEVQVPLAGIANLPAGTRTISVVRPIKLSGTINDHPAAGFSSTGNPFMLRPVIVNPPATAASKSKISIKLSPVVAVNQQVTLLLNAPGGNGVSVNANSFTVASDTLTFTLPALSAAKYLMRVVVDGADSPLKQSTAGAYTGPILEVTS